MADDDGRPSFAEVVKALTPPGTDWEQFKAAMRQVHRTGGHYPGKPAPDISQPGTIPASLHKQFFDVTPPGEPASLPPDPFSSDYAAGVACADMLRTLVEGGMPLGSAERVIGAMLAAHGIFQEGKPGG